MANDYISRNEAMHAMQPLSPPETAFAAMDILHALPAADVVPVVHARWVDKCARDWHCSKCGKRVHVTFDGYCKNDKLDYCPNCGARMDKEAPNAD